MTPVTKRILALALLATLSASIAVPAATNPPSGMDMIDQLLGDPVLAKGKDVEVKRSQLDAEMLNVRAMASAQGRTIPPSDMSLLEREKLNELIAFQILLKRATDADKAEGKVRFEKLLARLKKDNKLTDAEFDEKLAGQLKLQGTTRAEWDQQRINQATVGVVLEQELKVNVTDADAKKYYDENPARFEQPEQVRASHILISTRDTVTGKDLTDEQKQAKRKEIDALRKRAVDGEDFAKLAKEYSEDPGSKDNGGEYTFGRGRMVPAFEAAAFSLETNQISDVVTTDYGYHIIKLGEKLPAKVITFDEVSDDLKDALRSKELQTQLRETDYLAKLIKGANVEILDEKLKKAGDLLPKPGSTNAPPQ